MRKALVIVPLLALAACATPRERCISEATQQARILQSQVNETRANISRGYALDTYQEVRTIDRRCSGVTESGETFFYDCPDVQTVNRQRPVPINMAEEQAKLADLERRLRQSAEATNARVQACIAAYPE